MANRRPYGRRKLWKAARRAGKPWGRDQVERPMRLTGVDGVRRGKRHTATTQADPRAPRHPDHVKRRWGLPDRPDAWWVADFTYVWTTSGFCYVSFVTDVFFRRMLGWRVTTSEATPLVLSALEQALATRRRTRFEFITTGLLHHSDAGSQGGFN
ncbi:MAG: DDE-type integrase/transposase/recombinase [Propionicimonas sp.]